MAPHAGGDPSVLLTHLRFMERDEPAGELLARCFVKPLHLGVPCIDAFAALRPGNVLEATGASCCGKTELLVRAAVTCVLPEEFGGNAGGVLFLDLDGRLDAARFPAELSRRLGSARAAAGQPSGVARAPSGTRLCAPDDPAYAASLARFRLLRCRNSAAVVRAAAALDLLVSSPLGAVAGSPPSPK